MNTPINLSFLEQALSSILKHLDDIEENMVTMKDLKKNLDDMERNMVTKKDLKKNLDDMHGYHGTTLILLQTGIASH